MLDLEGSILGREAPFKTQLRSFLTAFLGIEKPSNTYAKMASFGPSGPIASVYRFNGASAFQMVSSSEKPAAPTTATQLEDDTMWLTDRLQAGRAVLERID
jgi:hypothetical protein